MIEVDDWQLLPPGVYLVRRRLAGRDGAAVAAYSSPESADQHVAPLEDGFVSVENRYGYPLPKHLSGYRYTDGLAQTAVERLAAEWLARQAS